MKPIVNSINSIDSSLFDQKVPNSIILTTFNDFSNWARISSLWPLLYGTSCCFIEFASLIGSRFDFDRYGLVPRSSPRQADLIITAGTVTCADTQDQQLHLLDCVCFFSRVLQTLARLT